MRSALLLGLLGACSSWAYRLRGCPRSAGPAMCAPADAGASRWKMFRKEGGLVLAASGPEWHEELVNVVVQRSEERPGLGLVLTEYAAAEDAALVLIDGIQPDGNAAVAASEAITVGDAIIGVCSPGDELVSVEGASYDDTVAAIGAVGGGPIQLLLKRLTRRPGVKVTLRFPESEARGDEQLTVYPGAGLRRSILAKGITLNDPLARRFDAGIGTGDCGGEGCCCTCAVEVVRGIELLSEQKTQERQMLRRFPRWRLACKANITPDLSEDAEMVLKVAPRGFDGFYADAECDIDGVPLKRPGQQ